MGQTCFQCAFAFLGIRRVFTVERRSKKGHVVVFYSTVCVGKIGKAKCKICNPLGGVVETLGRFWKVLGGSGGPFGDVFKPLGRFGGVLADIEWGKLDSSLQLLF